MNLDNANEALRQLGFNPQFVAAGMEGFVFDVSSSRLAKVWITKSLLEVQQISSFYTRLGERKLPFATPQIHDVLESYTGSVVSIEERLTGVTLRSILENNPDNEVLYNKGMIAVVSIVEALMTIGDIPIVRKLPLLGETSMWTPNSTWGMVLANLVALRANRYKSVLAQFVPNIEYITTRVVSLIKSLNVTHVGVIHGDICPENVLVDEGTLAPTALLDFSFLTTSADPLFDAVISTLIFEMYSSRVQKVRKSLYNAYSQKQGQHFVDVYPLYKTAYALITSNVYSEDGNDGHFGWCVDILNDEETRTLIM